MHCESWTCAYVCNTIFRHTCRPVQLNVWVFFFLLLFILVLSFTEPKTGHALFGEMAASMQANLKHDGR